MEVAALRNEEEIKGIKKMKIINWVWIVLLLGINTVVRAEHYEVFLLAGQSNMDGRGVVKQLTGDLAEYAKPNTNVLIHFSAGGLRRPLTVSQGFKALEPGYSGTPGNANANALPTGTFGCEVSFGPAMAAALPGKHVLLVKFAEGGTKLATDWNPDAKGKLYENFIKFVKKTQEMVKAKGDTCTIRGMLWHQGESDAGLPAGAYEKALTEFIARVRADLGMKDLPFVIGQVYDNGKRSEVIAGQKAVAKAVPHTGFVDAAGLETSDKGTHFTAKSQIELGKRFALELTKLLQPVEKINQ
jgi:iduronate 2-sulfatase